MITIEMISAAIFSFLGLSALIVAVTQMLKNLFKSEERWLNHLLSFAASLVCTGIVLLIGVHYGIGIFAAFCLNCLSSWTTFAGMVIANTGVANGMWSYEVAKDILRFVGLLNKEEDPSLAAKQDDPKKETE